MGRSVHQLSKDMITRVASEKKRVGWLIDMAELELTGPDN